MRKICAVNSETLRYSACVLTSIVSAALSGCGGGGGGSSPAVLTVLQRNAGVNTGLAVAAQYTYNAITDTGTLTSNPEINASTVTVTPSGSITSAVLTTPNARVGSDTSSWSSPGDTFVIAGADFQACSGTDCNTALRGMELNSTGFQYLTYGGWGDETSTSGTAIPGTMGLLIVGQTTAPSNVPSTGGATYNGATSGTFINTGTGALGIFSAAFTATADFGARTVHVASSNTQLDFGSGVPNDPTYNYSGTLSYAPGTNQFSGSINAPAGVTGTATGQFFGPAAQELGGVLKGSGGPYQVMGIFVGKQ